MNQEIDRILKDHEDRIRELERKFGESDEPPAKGKKLSAKEFIIEKAPKDDVQKTLAFGYYLEKREKLPSFNIKDIEGAFRAAKEPVPKNINYEIFRNSKKGHVMEAKEKKDNMKSWTLTNSGERFVESGFEKS